MCSNSVKCKHFAWILTQQFVHTAYKVGVHDFLAFVWFHFEIKIHIFEVDHSTHEITKYEPAHKFIAKVPMYEDLWSTHITFYSDAVSILVISKPLNYYYATLCSMICIFLLFFSEC